jgi:hypothetical protein
MAANGYERWWLNKTDTVYYKKGAFPVGSAEKLRLALMEGYVKFRRDEEESWSACFRGGGGRKKGTKMKG